MTSVASIYVYLIYCLSREQSDHALRSKFQVSTLQPFKSFEWNKTFDKISFFLYFLNINAYTYYTVDTFRPSIPIPPPASLLSRI